jgi:hypothetical protein
VLQKISSVTCLDVFTKQYQNNLGSTTMVSETDTLSTSALRLTLPYSAAKQKINLPFLLIITLTCPSPQPHLAAPSSLTTAQGTRHTPPIAHTWSAYGSHTDTVATTKPQITNGGGAEGNRTPDLTSSPTRARATGELRCSNACSRDNVVTIC